MPKAKLVSIKEVGIIREVKRSVVKIDGLTNCMVGQLINFQDGTKGFVMSFNEAEVLVLLLGQPGELKAGDKVFSETNPFQIPVGKNFIGRVVDPLCEACDGKGEVIHDEYYNIFEEAPSVLTRIPIMEMLYTGIRTIDSNFPVGKGQRQLIIGDRMTGKTSIAVDTIINQKGKNVVCIYCCIGRDYASFEKVISILKQHGALKYTVIIAGLASAPIGEQYLAPFTAATLGEYFMRSGKDVFVVFDDLTKHAWAYRELSLLLERPPGREAYPGDIFYQHAQLMERAGKLSDKEGGGSMTFFPLADTLHGDIAGFIPTNLISMTDGQIYLNSGLFSEGFKPAIDLGLSVSRIGTRVQSPLMREFTAGTGLRYIQHRELLKTTKLRAGISEDMDMRLRRGEKIERIFVQRPNEPSSVEETLILFYALRRGLLDDVPDEKCEQFKKEILKFVREKIPDVCSLLAGEKDLANLDREKLNSCIMDFLRGVR
jgi:F-type H+-transporting ATPase subunit alpha